MTTEQLVELRKATDAALEVLQKNRVLGPINWADLHCLQAAWVVTDDGSSYVEVTIEEASPEAAALQSAVAALLAAEGWQRVVVMTEW